MPSDARELDSSMLDEIRDLADGDEDLLGEIIDTYLDDVLQRLSTLRAAVAERDAERIHRTAHTIKGSSANLGLLGMVDTCRAVVEAGRAGDLDDIDARLAAIEAAFDRARAILAEHR